MRYVAGIAAGALIVALGGCGDDGQGGGNDAQANATGAATADDGPVVSEGTQAPADHAQAAAGQPQPKRTGVLRDPDDDAIGWLVADWLSLDLPLADWARERVEKRRGIDEFAKDESKQRELAQLREARAAAKGIGRIKTVFDGRLSEYDTDYGEFYLKTFTPGSVITFRPFSSIADNPLSHGVKLRFRNGGDASVWSVDPATAKKVADALGYGRSVRLNTTLAIADVSSSDRGATVLADVISYDVYDGDGRRLGHVDVGGPAKGAATPEAASS